VSLFDKLFKSRAAPAPAFRHDAPDLENTLPAAVAGRSLVRWSVAGDNFWAAMGGNRARSAWTPDLAAIGVSPTDLEMAVAGRAHPKDDPPYIIWAVRFAKSPGINLAGPAPSSLAMGVMHVDPNQGDDWRQGLMGDRRVLVGNSSMVRQDAHHRGVPVVYLTSTVIYALIADDDEWSTEVIGALPAG
jgi:hypothetical protein